MTVHLRVLGPLRVSVGGRELAVPGAVLSRLLGLLAVEAGTVVPLERLYAAVWGPAVPRRPRDAIQVAVGRLRRLLGDADGTVVVTRPPGYLLDAGAAAVDAAEFRDLVEEGRILVRAGRPAEAAPLLGAALELWTGDPLPGVEPADRPWPELARLRELHRFATVARVDAAIALGRAAELVPDLERLTADDPTGEGALRRLMLALASAGRPAEAAAAFRSGRAALGEQLGLDPGADVRRLYRDLTAPAAEAGAAGVLLRAGRFAAGLGNHAEALARWEDAVALLPPDAPGLPALLLDLADARYFVAGTGGAEAARARAALEAAGDRAGVRYADGLLARAAWAVGDRATALSHAHAATGPETGPGTGVEAATGTVRAAVGAALGAAVLAAAGVRPAGLLAGVEAAVRALADTADGRTQALVLDRRAAVRFEAGDVAGAAADRLAARQRFERVGWAPAVLLAEAAEVRLAAADLPGAAETVAAALAAAGWSGSEWGAQWAELLAAELDRLAGRPAARARAAAAAGTASRRHPGAAPALLCLARLELAAARPPSGPAAAAVAAAREQPEVLPAALGVQALAWLLDDRPDLAGPAAREALARAAGAPPRWPGCELAVAAARLHLPPPPPSPWSAATRAVAAGNAAAAAAAYESLGSTADATLVLRTLPT